MNLQKAYDVIIVGGSFAGLSAAMSLGRALRSVLVIDGGSPCNRQTPFTHNFLTQDGQSPQHITETGKAQVLKYPTVSFCEGMAVSGMQTADGFEIETQQGEIFKAKKLIFCTGIADQMLPIPGFSDCWGISVLHCPFCHGYEVISETTALLGKGNTGFGLCRLISNWSKNVVLFTNGASDLSEEQASKIAGRKIQLVETEIDHLEHENGYLQKIVLNDGSHWKVNAMYAPVPFKQHCDIPASLGCNFDEHGYIDTDEFRRTSVPGVYAAGDNITTYRAVSYAVSSGSIAGITCSKDLIEDEF
ncbi:MAG: NAD(P)/FAD-dependent oxidoreductase [Bacteroidota bacterium]